MNKIWFIKIWDRSSSFEFSFVLGSRNSGINSVSLQKQIIIMSNNLVLINNVFIWVLVYTYYVFDCHTISLFSKNNNNSIIIIIIHVRLQLRHFKRRLLYPLRIKYNDKISLHVDEDEMYLCWFDTYYVKCW
jgi:hypothetical protein